MRRKGIYPYMDIPIYEYMDSWNKFEETSLAQKDTFYRRLNVKGISDLNYEHATDVLLLADLFETFRNTCLKNYKLDPAYFYTASGLAWQALLKTAAEYLEHEKRGEKCEVCPDEFRPELLTDIDMLLMVEKGIRGRITQAVKRYAKANNKSMKSLTIPMKRACSSVPRCKQLLRMGNGSKYTNASI